MKSDQFFLREKYSTEEKVDRIPSSQINPGNKGFAKALDRNGLDENKFSGYNKSDFFERISVELDTEARNNLIDDLFEKCGQEGDKFNIQMYELAPNASYTEVIDKAQIQEESQLDDYAFLDHALYLQKADVNSIQHRGSNERYKVLDFAFKTREEVEDIEPTDELPVRILFKDGEVEATYGDGYHIEAPSRTRIEARLYIENKSVAVSNGSGIKSGPQTDIVQLIEYWGNSGDDDE